MPYKTHNATELRFTGTWQQCEYTVEHPYSHGPWFYVGDPEDCEISRVFDKPEHLLEYLEEVTWDERYN